MTPKIEVNGPVEMESGQAGPNRMQIDINAQLVLVGTPETLAAIGAGITAQVANELASETDR